MNDSKKLFWPSAMMHGLFLGIVLVLYNIITYAIGKYSPEGVSSPSDLILIVGIVWAQLSFRKKQEDKTMTYGTALGYGTVVVLFSSILFAIFLLIMFRYVDHSLIPRLKTVGEQTLLDSGYTPDMVEKQMSIASQYVYTPEFLSGSTIFSFALMGFLISLITSIFTKKSYPDDFKNAMKKVETESFVEQKETNEILPRNDENKEDSGQQHNE